MVLRRGHGNYWMQQLRACPGLPQHSTGQKSLVFPSFILRLSSAFPGGILYTLLPRKPASAFMAESCLSLFVPLRRFSQSIDFLRLRSLEILATSFDDGPDEWQMAVLTGLIFIDSVSIGAMNVSASFSLWNSVDRVVCLSDSKLGSTRLTSCVRRRGSTGDARLPFFSTSCRIAPVDILFLEPRGHLPGQQMSLPPPCPGTITLSKQMDR